MPGSPSFNYPVVEPNSALQFQDLLLRVATKLGVAYYGASGTGVPQVPVNGSDYAICSDVVNDAVRMFIADGPKPDGWTWQKPITQIDVWPLIVADASSASIVTASGYDGTGTYLTSNSTATSGPFYPSMEMRNIYYGGNPPPGTPGYNPPLTGTLATTTGTAYAILAYQSPTQVYVQGNIPAGSAVWSIVSTGDFTLPLNFGGQLAGEITYIANTNRGVSLHWTTDALIRARRSNYNLESGTPFECAVRLVPPLQYSLIQYNPPRPRWELMTWRIPNEVLHMIFPYQLMFTKLVNLTDTPPSPFSFDDCLIDACLAKAEYYRDDTIQGPAWMNYKQSSLPTAIQIDGRAKPRNLGYNSNASSDSITMGEAIDRFRQLSYQRPTVGYNPAIT